MTFFKSLFGFLITFFAIVTYAQDIQHKESLEEAGSFCAFNARKLVHDDGLGISTLISIFPKNASNEWLQGKPTGMLEYYAPSESHPGSVYLLLMPISPNVQNILATPDYEATLSIKDEKSEIEKGTKWAVDRARLALWGKMTIIEPLSAEALEATKAFTKQHPDSTMYLPPLGPHKAFWARFDPENIYYLGGFGGTHYLGYIPLDMYLRADPHSDKLDNTRESHDDNLFRIQDQQ